jgi:hypothetical protein
MVCQEAMEACLEKAKANQKKTRTDLEETGAKDLEANRENSEAVAVHYEVPNEEAAVGYRNARKRRTKDDVARGDNGCARNAAVEYGAET